jgi:hypothetical protein
MTDAPWAWPLMFTLGACGTQNGNSGGSTPLGTGSGDSDGSAASGSGASSSGSSATNAAGFGMGGAAQIWMDGQLIQYYDIGTTAGPNKVTQFDHIEVGFHPFHSLSLVTYDRPTPPLMTEMRIDDIAFEVKRIGCP